MSNHQSSQFLIFSIRGEEHAVPVLRVREILEYQPVTRVPAAPAEVRGVINLRGAVLPVVDLAARLGLGASEPSRTTCIVVVEAERRGEVVAVGVLADAVAQVIDIPEVAIEPPPAFGTAAARGLLDGVAKLEGRMVLVLDLDRVLAPGDGHDTVVAVPEPASLPA